MYSVVTKDVKTRKLQSGHRYVEVVAGQMREWAAHRDDYNFRCER